MYEFRQPHGPMGATNSTSTVLTTLRSPVWQALSVASTAAGAYHGYKRHKSIGWALWWGLMGGLFPVVTPAIALAQGFGKAK